MDCAGSTEADSASEADTSRDEDPTRAAPKSGQPRLSDTDPRPNLKAYLTAAASEEEPAATSAQPQPNRPPVLSPLPRSELASVISPQSDRQPISADGQAGYVSVSFFPAAVEESVPNQSSSEFFKAPREEALGNEFLFEPVRIDRWDIYTASSVPPSISSRASSADGLPAPEEPEAGGKAGDLLLAEGSSGVDVGAPAPSNAGDEICSKGGNAESAPASAGASPVSSRGAAPSNPNSGRSSPAALVLPSPEAGLTSRGALPGLPEPVPTSVPVVGAPAVSASPAVSPSSTLEGTLDADYGHASKAGGGSRLGPLVGPAAGRPRSPDPNAHPKAGSELPGIHTARGGVRAATGLPALEFDGIFGLSISSPRGRDLVPGSDGMLPVIPEELGPDLGNRSIFSDGTSRASTPESSWSPSSSRAGSAAGGRTPSQSRSRPGSPVEALPRAALAARVLPTDAGGAESPRRTDLSASGAATGVSRPEPAVHPAEHLAVKATPAEPATGFPSVIPAADVERAEPAAAAAAVGDGPGQWRGPPSEEAESVASEVLSVQSEELMTLHSSSAGGGLEVLGVEAEHSVEGPRRE